MSVEAVTKDAAFDALECAGRGMANLCFNLSQQDYIPASLRMSMKKAQGEWDAALRALLDLQREGTPPPSTHLEGWTGNKCEPCKGHGVRMQDGEERSCPDCAGTGDEYGTLSDPTDEINPYEQALRDAVEPFLDWLDQREEGAHIQEVREGLIGVEDVIPDDHVVLGAHLRAHKDQGVLTIGHFRRLQAAYDGKATPSPQPREVGE